MIGLNGERKRDIYQHNLIDRMYEIEKLYPYFPNLPRTTPKSKADPSYNCIAFAAGDNKRIWDPLPSPNYHWPTEEYYDYSLEACIRVFETVGFIICDNPDLEDGFEKIAIWSKGNEYEHAAKQRVDGKWMSKVGFCEDIEHELDDFYCTDPIESYGNIACYMKRPRPVRPKHRSRSSGSST